MNDRVRIKSKNGEIRGLITKIEYIETAKGRVPRMIIVFDSNGRYHEYVDGNSSFPFIEREQVN